LAHTAAPLPAFAQDLGDGIFAIDTGFHRPVFDAAYLIVEAGRAAFVDTGTNFSVPRLLATLEALGLPRDAVDFVIPTHVHLDHAGGVGLLMRALPQAQLLVHPRGARHMIDPSALYQGALAVYGAEAMATAYGNLLPVAADRVQATSDMGQVTLAGRPLLFIDTPGHARHHHCLWDARSQGWFTGDTFGLGYGELATTRGAWVMPTSTPVQFEPDALHRSIDRLLGWQPRWMYLTHYGRVGDVPRLAGLLHQQIDAMVALAQGLASQPAGAARHGALVAGLQAMCRDQLAAHGVADLDAALAALALDIGLNAQGLAIWLDRDKR
jgi:glyoxylase-like metal-dependent hydrolase (beta-lactamase superfamily II)